MTDFYKDKVVFITGCTGFKGSWLCQMLLCLGVKQIVGYSLDAPTNPNLFKLLKLKKKITYVKGDILDYRKLKYSIDKYSPDIVIHLAAQPLVLDGYRCPQLTFNTNVMGTVNVLNATRKTTVSCILNVTTDKIYRDVKKEPYVESDELGGFDPYSNSKACSELVTQCYYDSFFKKEGITVLTARAGNVIGGGDFSSNRIIPDCVKHIISWTPIEVRNPNSIRPYQHVFDVLYAYLCIIEKYYNSGDFQSFNIGPKKESVIDTKTLVAMVCENCLPNKGWKDVTDVGAPHETECLLLNSSKLRNTLNYYPKYTIQQSVKNTLDWYMSNCYSPKNIISYSIDKLNNYLNLWKI